MKRSDVAAVAVHNDDGTVFNASIRIDSHSRGWIVLQVEYDKPGEPDRVGLWRHAIQVAAPVGQEGRLP